MYNQITSNKRRTFVLIWLFIIFVLFLGWLLGKLTGYGYWGVGLAMAISLALALFSYYKGDKVALWTAGARLTQKKDNPYVWRLVENLCLSAGLPLPKIYLIPEEAPNAFATGRDPNHAAIALTNGLIQSLENEELEGVIAHELSHIKNYDIRLMTIVIVLIGTIVLLSDWLLRAQLLGGSRRSSRESGQMGIILIIGGIILAILAPLIAQIIQLAISRKREFLADASSALMTRYPEGLARALEKIAAYKIPLQRASHATAHLYIANPLGPRKNFLNKLFSTHPPIEERIKALRNMA